MDEVVGRRALGSYEIVRELEPCSLSRRWLATLADDQSTHVLYEFSHCRDRFERRRFVEAVQALAELDHAHILAVERLTLVESEPWLVTPYTGNQDGLVTLEALLEAKGGAMPASEAARALVQLLEALEYAHDHKQHHGPVSIEQVLVDRHGSVAIELFGMSRRLHGLVRGNEVLKTDEVRSLVEMGYRLITGREASEPRIDACKLTRGLDRRWDEWFDRGLDPLGGFRSAGEALRAFPTRSRAPDTGAGVGAVRVVIGRVRSALRQE